MRFFASLAGSALLLSSVARSAPPEPSRPASRKPADPQWNVRVDVLMVAMPQEKLLPLLPDLRDPKKIDGAVEQLLAAVRRKEAILTGYPSVTTLDGVRCVSETTFEKRYPVGYALAENANDKAAAAPPAASDPVATQDLPVPTAFESRSLGVTLEAEPHVSARGDTIRLDVFPVRSDLIRFDSFDTPEAIGGKTVKIEQPQFSISKVLTSLVVQNGQRTLIAVHLLTKPEKYMEVFVLQAWATPVK